MFKGGCTGGGRYCGHLMNRYFSDVVQKALYIYNLIVCGKRGWHFGMDIIP